MTRDDIDRVVKAFRKAAIRAKNAGFDGIQLHGGHGYLFSQFLSPFYNKRTDAYGGNIENRARIVLETYDQVRNAVGDEYPVLIKMNVTDDLDDGLSTDEALEVASMYDVVGFDTLELSSGTGWGLRILGDVNRHPCKHINDEAYYRDTAQRLKQMVETPIILTGGIRSYDLAAQIVRDNIADYIGLCRPLIREPDLVNRWKSGDTRKSGCLSDNACLFLGLEKGLKCFQKI
jgi:2,4-dienoyl-CoA reductase-like NADH-dependent reductase (Old Yellow Enzyme family)